MKTNRPKILVVVKGGLVQGVTTNTDMEVVICDFDQEGDVDERGQDMLANVYHETPLVVSDKFWKAAFTDADKRERYAINELKELNV